MSITFHQLVAGTGGTVQLQCGGREAVLCVRDTFSVLGMGLRVRAQAGLILP